MGAGRRSARRRKRDLALLLRSSAVFLSTGFDLSYAWEVSRQALNPYCGEEMRGLLAQGSGGFREWLEVWRQGSGDPAEKAWVCLLQDLYQSGAPVAGTVRAFAQSLETALQREREAHWQRLNGVSQCIFLLFFTPLALFLLFFPLVHRLASF